MTLTDHEQELLRRIVVASENDPDQPEFPPEDPKFPATPTYKIDVPGFTNVWLKDESHNPTGTHKDRMAWEIVVTYRNFLLAKERGQLEGPLPQMSIISSGSAAVAIQSRLKEYGLPNLKVLCDMRLSQANLQAMRQLGCEIYQVDLSRKPFDWREILHLTNNPDGFDITSSEALDPNTRFYDWLSYEIMNNDPEYCLIPFGTGNLFENVLNITKKEVQTEEHDPRFSGNREAWSKCNFLGATTNNPNTRAEKLYSPHLPFVHFDEQWMRFYRYSGFCGPKSDVHLLREEYLEQAMRLAEKQGIPYEPSGIAGLGLLLQLQDKIPRDAKIVIVNTGKTKTPWVEEPLPSISH